MPSYTSSDFANGSNFFGGNDNDYYEQQHQILKQSTPSYKSNILNYQNSAYLGTLYIGS